MRNTMRWLLGAAAVLALTHPASAQVPMSGLAASSACDAVLDASVELGEFYMVKVPMNGDCTDMQFDLSNTGGPQITGTSAGNPLWAVGANWKVSQTASDTHFLLLLYPPDPGKHANRMVVDGGSIADGGDMGLTRIQTVGNSIPSGQDASIGITLPGTAVQYSVQTRPGTMRNFPVGTPSNGINVAFAPVVDVNDNDPGAAGCNIAGRYPDPSDMGGNNPTPTRGVIIGYNVYRIGGSASAVPDVDAFMAALTDGNAATGFQYFLDVRKFRLGSADTNPGMEGTNAPSDADPNDLAGLQNPDGRMYSGDEALVFQDSTSNRGTGRGAGNGTAPVLTNSYWYAFQPVICGRVTQFQAALGFTNSNTFAGTDHRRDLDMDGSFDAVNLDNDAGDRIEFISPQANNGQDGLGLTYSGKLLLSEPVFYNSDNVAVPLPASGKLTLVGQVKGEDVQIQFSTGLESGNVQGYNVYRVAGESHVRVNDQPILARGSEANVYQVVDKAAAGRRLVHGGNLTYEVEVLHNDGSASTTVGPFSVGEEKQAAPGRRRR